MSGASRQEFFEPGSLDRLDAQAAAEWLGEAPGPSGMLVRDALVIDPAVKGWTPSPLVFRRLQRVELRE